MYLPYDDAGEEEDKHDDDDSDHSAPIIFYYFVSCSNLYLFRIKTVLISILHFL